MASQEAAPEAARTAESARAAVSVWTRSLEAILDNPALFMAGILLAMWAILSRLSPFFFTLDNLFDPLISQLSSDSVIYIGDPDQIELDVFIPLAACLANQAGPSFGGAFNDQAWARDTATLRRVSWAAPTYEPLKSETF